MLVARRASRLLACRNVATMATPTRSPAEPLLVILGSTGTGKSELAVELARRFRGEIVNADAMQLYAGLPIITNKVTTEEQRGVPHHLLGHIPLREPPWDADDYAREAARTIAEIRARGNLPIVVGGTQYYVDPLLFRDIRLGDQYPNDAATFPILDEPTDIILAELRRVDPVMASRWHPNDRRKIQRSLEIYLRSGKPASVFYAEQAERKAREAAEAASSGGASPPWENLLFWVFSERETLKARLDARVDKMLDAGLLDEVREVLTLKRSQEAAGHEVDMSRGIWQSIGYRQFEPYLEAVEMGRDSSEVEKLKAAGVEDTKVATRRYAQSQTRWTRLKQFPLLVEQGPQALDSLYLLDSTDASAFATSVVEPAADITNKFLQGDARPHPTELSPLAAEVLGNAREIPPPKTPCQKKCDICGVSTTTEEMWEAHIKSYAHRRVVKRKRRLSLVPVESPAAADEAASSPEIGDLFM